MCVVGWQPKPLDQLPSNGGEGVAVEIADRGQPMALTT